VAVDHEEDERIHDSFPIAKQKEQGLVRLDQAERETQETVPLASSRFDRWGLGTNEQRALPARVDTRTDYC
jgi:hypothetical protein